MLIYSPASSFSWASLLTIPHNTACLSSPIAKDRFGLSDNFEPGNICQVAQRFGNRTT